VRWPWRKRPGRLMGGAQAHQEATENLADARAKGPEVRRVAASLRELREQNHFAVRIERLYQGGRS